jgi:hypothetical protein
MKLKEKDIIRLIFVFFIIIGFIVLIWNYNKHVIEGATNIGNGCNDCRISPTYGKSTHYNYDQSFSQCTQLYDNIIAFNNNSATNNNMSPVSLNFTVIKPITITALGTYSDISYINTNPISVSITHENRTILTKDFTHGTFKSPNIYTYYNKTLLQSINNFVLKPGTYTLTTTGYNGLNKNGKFANSISHTNDEISYITNLDAGGSFLYTVNNYVFCPWDSYATQTNINNPSWYAECSNNMYNDASCCYDDRESYYNKHYLHDPKTDQKQYGLLFDISKISSSEHTSGVTGGYDPTQESQSHITSDLYNFKLVTQANVENALFNNTYHYKTSNDKSKILTQNSSQNLDKYINCQGHEISFNNLDNVAYISKACQKLYPNIGYGNYTIEQGVNFCMQSAQYCEISNVMTDCSLLLPKYTPSNEWYRISPGPGAQASPVGGFDIDGSIQTGLQSAVDQLVSKFTQQITSLTSQIGESLQFPNLGQVKYLDVGACNNNAPYVYNSGCDTSLGYLGQYTCYPSLTGAFSDCGPPGYDAKPQF